MITNLQHYNACLQSRIFSDLFFQLLKEEKQPPSFWTFEYYQQYFDVDTYDVLHRSVGSMLPNPNKNFLKNYVRPNPDLYGKNKYLDSVYFNLTNG